VVSDRSAPIVANHSRGPLMAKGGDDLPDIFDQEFQGVIFYPLRAIGIAVSPEIKGNTAEPLLGEISELVPPGIPEFWEAMQEKEEGTLLRTHAYTMEGKAICPHIKVLPLPGREHVHLFLGKEEPQGISQDPGKEMDKEAQEGNGGEEEDPKSP